ncbi:type II secretion system ATPase GspE [Yersinia ruckeri]|uniref:type II secretion system ATPase GspE n=1 Tax=Yersinia ruckeri TaxID=29486 RepID=UPI0020C09A0B|nr:type II secretion system ATPase GspE [Yersinia ruckeri]MCK8542702.1 type II secretion system ATPase GspE [Yersinia ruckeri]MCK8552167.1 type II secretion system ATPase GspE [Yersinia ruckeri]MCW6520558.1 type II secretion system ATPase GspE [Yersinia ruckeri]MCW6552662.1 type II secretion system ATPase GspE [Yersinia ruckeri]MCW6558818.1 type II secretion system ATPase GspE [Yersinia ruckeri]
MELNELLPASKYKVLPFSWAKEHGALIIPTPIGCNLICRSSVIFDDFLEAYRVASGKIELTLLPNEEFEQNLVDFYQNDTQQAQQIMDDIGNELDLGTLIEQLPKDEDLLNTVDEAPIIRLINVMISQAIKEVASDIHIEPFERRLIIRFRIDGVLSKVLEPPPRLASLLISRIKVMAKLDIAEKRVPQDGRIALRMGGRALDIRVSTLPSSHGERAVLRILDKNSVKLDLETLGINQKSYKLIKRLVQQPHGIILVTGPTGSGKSTTLYAALMEIDRSVRNIMTIEDPIEFDLDGIAQTQVNAKAGMTFSKGLRAILRQDPDVILIGEIRDSETARIATQASLTGHLVLSTLHTNTAAGTITRLKDMGVEAYMLSSSLLAVLSQRLVRKLCVYCRVPYVFSPLDLEIKQSDKNKLEKMSGYKSKGCEKCNYIGYRGRTVIHELVILDDKMRKSIYKGNGEIELERLARELVKDIKNDGIDKIIQGITSVEEVLRVTREDVNGYI